MHIYLDIILHHSSQSILCTMYTEIYKCILNSHILTKLCKNKQCEQQQQPGDAPSGPGVAVPVHSGVLALGVHDADDHGVGVDVGRGARVVTSVVRTNTRDL